MGIKKGEKENEDPREEGSTQGDSEARRPSCAFRERAALGVHIKKEAEEEPDFDWALKTPESTYKKIPLIDLTQSPPSPGGSSPFYKGSPVDFDLTKEEEEEEEDRAEEPSTKRTRRYCDRRPA